MGLTYQVYDKDSFVAQPFSPVLSLLLLKSLFTVVPQFMRTSPARCCESRHPLGYTQSHEEVRVSHHSTWEQDILPEELFSGSASTKTGLSQRFSTNISKHVL